MPPSRVSADAVNRAEAEETLDDFEDDKPGTDDVTDPFDDVIDVVVEGLLAVAGGDPDDAVALACDLAALVRFVSIPAAIPPTVAVDAPAGSDGDDAMVVLAVILATEVAARDVAPVTMDACLFRALRISLTAPLTAVRPGRSGKEKYTHKLM